MLVPLCVVEWLGIAYEVRHIQHNGWLFGRGRTETIHYTTAWLLAHGHVAHVPIGFGWPLVLVPFAWIAGANLLAALPGMIVLQVLLLVPLGIVAAYALGARSGGGRLVGYLAAGLWALGPFLSVRYFQLHSGWHERVVPELLGLTLRPELPATVAVAGAGVLALRAADRRSWRDAVGAAALAGAAAAIVPANVVFLAAPVVLLAATRRWRELGAFAAALVPVAAAYALWTSKSVGHVTLPLPHHHFPTWGELRQNWVYIKLTTWSARVLEWATLAGFVALVRRSPAKALFYGTWVGAYALAEGTSRSLRAYGDSFWHLFMPAFPAFCVLAASLPLLWPRAVERIPERWPYRPRVAVPALPIAVAVLLVLLLVPAAVPRLGDELAVRIPNAGWLAPLDRGPTLDLRDPKRVAWSPVGGSHARIRYNVYRAEPNTAYVACTTHPGAKDCTLAMKRVASTRKTSFVERSPHPTAVYAVGVAADSPGRPVVLIGPAAAR